jgi:hypothetical protein
MAEDAMLSGRGMCKNNTCRTSPVLLLCRTCVVIARNCAGSSLFTSQSVSAFISPSVRSSVCQSFSVEGCHNSRLRCRVFHWKPITAPQKEHSTPSDQSQPLRRNIPHHPTNHSPPEGTFYTIRPIIAPQREYSISSDQSQSPRRNIPHHPTNHIPSEGISHIIRPITAPQKVYSLS